MRNKAAIAAIIDALGISALAREFGHRNATTVGSWKFRGLIPVSYWPGIVAFAEKLGRADISLDVILAAHFELADDSGHVLRQAEDEGEAPPTQPEISAGGERTSSTVDRCG